MSHFGASWSFQVKSQNFSFFVLPIDTSANGLRKIHVPGELVSHFLRLASDNTRKNLETCGILAGRLVSSTIVGKVIQFKQLLKAHFHRKCAAITNPGFFTTRNAEAVESIYSRFLIT